jgi:hypothetical protein
MAKPFTPTQFKVLEAAFYGDAYRASLSSRRVRTRTIYDLNGRGLLNGYKVTDQVGLTINGLKAYVDMCERRDADSGCIAYMQRAEEARKALHGRVAERLPA